MRTDRHLLKNHGCVAGKEESNLPERWNQEWNRGFRHPEDREKAPTAPYGFVPLSELVLEDRDGIPCHNALDPDRKSGEIQIRIKAETPILVSGQTKKPEGGKEAQECTFFRDSNGCFTIPGSSFRGLLRQNCQILGFGLFRKGEDFQDYAISFRSVAGRDKTLREYYHTVMGLKQGGPNQTSNVQAGYISTNDGKKYFLFPVPWNRVQRIRRSDPRLDDLYQKYADDKDMINERVFTVDTAGNRWRAVDENLGLPRLVCTGRYVGMQNPHYLIPAPGPYMRGGGIPVPEEDILAFREDFEARRTTLRKKQYWDLPPRECVKPIFFVRHNGHIYLGMARNLRIEYPHTISEGLPKAHQALQQSGILDYPHALFGFMENGGYRSRVSVGDFPAEGKPMEAPSMTVTPGQPKPSWYYGYLQPGERYLDHDFRIRGHKQYWLKEARVSNDEAKNKKVSRVLRPLQAGTVFRGTIRFKNLSEMELGLLLWAIRLNPGCYQTIGMGKAFGLGRASIEIEKLRIQNVERSYQELTASPWDDKTDQIGSLIDLYDQKALAVKTGPERVSSRKVIQDFFFLRSTLRKPEDVRYMALKEFQNNRNWLPITGQVREETQKLKEGKK